MDSEPRPDAPDAPTEEPSAGPAGGDAGGEAGGDAWGARKALEVLAIAFVFPLALYVGFVAGRWVGERFGAPGPGGLIGAALGAAAGFWELYRFVRRSWPR
jgi:hypothetical protein